MSNFLRFQDRAYTIDEITKVAFKASLGRKPRISAHARRTSEVLQIFAALREPLVRKVEEKPAAYTYCGPGKVSNGRRSLQVASATLTRVLLEPSLCKLEPHFRFLSDMTVIPEGLSVILPADLVAELEGPRHVKGYFPLALFFAGCTNY